MLLAKKPEAKDSNGLTLRFDPPETFERRARSSQIFI